MVALQRLLVAAPRPALRREAWLSTAGLVATYLTLPTNHLPTTPSLSTYYGLLCLQALTQVDLRGVELDKNCRKLLADAVDRAAPGTC